MPPLIQIEPSPESAAPMDNNNVGNESERALREDIAWVDQIYDKKRQRYRYVKTAKSKSRAETFSRYVIIAARRISAQGLPSGEWAIDIRGEHLLKILSEAYHNVDHLRFFERTTLDSTSVNLLFYEQHTFHERLMDAEAAQCPDHDLIFELKAVSAFIQKYFHEKTPELSLLSQSRVIFDTVWAVFRPNEMVFGIDRLQQPQVFRLKDSHYGKTKEGVFYFALEMDYVDSNGRSTGYVHHAEYNILSFEGSKDINSLPYFPLSFHGDYPNIKEALIRRGENVLRLHGRGHLQEYRGHAMDGQEGDGAARKFTADGRVVLDPATFDNMIPNNRLVPLIRAPIRPQQMTDDQKLLLSPVLYGFNLSEKRWGGFAIERLQPVQWNDDIFNKLVLPNERKVFLLSLVRSRRTSSAKTEFDDFVQNKGKGLVGLLAGPPGVGKTLTAEAIAEVAHRPLYMISSGELGETSSSVERNLGFALKLAQSWQAVLLLDEADVFLSERDNVNLARNAITSIFLRNLEYYQGLLLLTTNRLSSLDSAFQSRIHFCYEYTDLDEDARSEIWSEFTSKVENHSISRTDISNLAKRTLNGRQIKNAMKISCTVATEQNTPLTLDRIHQALELGGSSWTTSARATVRGFSSAANGSADPKLASSSAFQAASSVSTHAQISARSIGLSTASIGIYVLSAVLSLGLILWLLNDIPDIVLKMKVALILTAIMTVLIGLSRTI
ncbi:hypothetical protein BJX65DRAFT_312274 [Aspergillus insuetus]